LGERIIPQGGSTYGERIHTTVCVSSKRTDICRTVSSDGRAHMWLEGLQNILEKGQYLERGPTCPEMAYM